MVVNELLRAADRGDHRSRYALTLVVEVVLLAAAVATLKLAADRFGTTGFGEFTVARRTVSVIAVPLLLGSGVAVTRYVAYGMAAARTYLLAAMCIGAPLLVLFAAGAAALAQPFAATFFGSEAYVGLVLPTALAIAGTALHAIAYSYFVGVLRMSVANALQLVNIGLAPVIAVMLSGGSAAIALALLGSVAAVTSIGAMVPVAVRRADTGPSAPAGLRPAAMQLLRYGVPRVPGDLAHFALFSIPTIVVAHRAGIEAAGFLSFGLALVHLVNAPFAAGRTLLLPVVSGLSAGGRRHEIQALLGRILIASALVAGAAVLILELALEPIVAALLGPDFSQAVPATRWVVLGAVPYGVYSVLRGPVDALAVWPHNSVNLTVSLAAVLILLAPGSFSAEVAVPIAFTLLALLTVGSTWWTAARAPAAIDAFAAASVPPK